MKKRLFLMLVLNIFILALSAQKVTKAKLVNDWVFAQITMISPKAGYIPTFEAKEANLFRICMANYKFNNDGSVGLTDEYIKKSGVNKASWKLNEKQTAVVITYFFTIDSEKYPYNKQESETFTWDVLDVNENSMQLSLMKMFEVKLTKNKK